MYFQHFFDVIFQFGCMIIQIENLLVGSVFTLFRKPLIVDLCEELKQISLQHYRRFESRTVFHLYSF